MVLAAEITREVEIPEGVTVSINGMSVTIKGAKGELSREFEGRDISIVQKDKQIVVSAKFPRLKDKAMLGTIEGHLSNMVAGVTNGYEYHLKIYYSHFPMNVSPQGNKVIIKNFLGEKYPREANIVGNTKVEVKGQDITVSGINREDVGQTSANIRLATKVGRRDPRVFRDGIFLVDKGDTQ